MGVSQIGATQIEKNIELTSLFTLFNEVEKTVFNSVQSSQIQQDYYKEMQPDAA